MPQAGASSPPPAPEANTEIFLDRRRDPQCGQRVPFQSVDRVSTSLSRWQPAQ